MPLETSLLLALLMFAVVGVIVFVTMTVARHEQAKLIHARELAAAEHAERLAMIEHGMAPPAEPMAAGSTREQSVMYSLSSVAGGVAFCAWLSGGGGAAWAAAGVIGLAAVIGVILVYLNSSGAAATIRAGRPLP